MVSSERQLPVGICGSMLQHAGSVYGIGVSANGQWPLGMYTMIFRDQVFTTLFIGLDSLLKNTTTSCGAGTLRGEHDATCDHTGLLKH